MAAEAAVAESVGVTVAVQAPLTVICEHISAWRAYVGLGGAH